MANVRVVASVDATRSCFMIGTFILYGLYVVLTVVLSPLRLLPDATLPAGLSGAITSASPYTSALNWIIPVDTLLTVLYYALIVDLAIWTLKIFNWSIRKIPGLK